MLRSFADRLLEELPTLLRVARRRTKNAADAEDLVQATVVRALERRADLRDPLRMRAWLLLVQRTVLLNGVRSPRARFEVIDGGGGSPDPRGDLEQEILDGGFADEVDRALGGLAPEWREALLLREVEELSYEDIARVQDCPVGTVRSRLARARMAMLDALSGDRTSDGERRWKAAAASGSRFSRRSATAK